jgi:hypothetical protein
MLLSRILTLLKAFSFDRSLKKSYVDLGAYIIKSSLFKNDSLMRFIKICKTQNVSIYEADGHLAFYIAERTIKKRIHRQVFLVHQ